jgi:hypothetical protein
VRLVIHHATVHFNPGVCSERQLLDSNHHLRVEALSFKQRSRRCGTLQTEHLFPIPDTSDVYRMTDLFNRVGPFPCIAYCLPMDFVTQDRELSSHQVQIEQDQLPIGF